MQKAHWHALQQRSEGSAVLFPSKKHVDATRAFASGFRGRKDGKEDPLAAGRLEDRSRAGRRTGRRPRPRQGRGAGRKENGKGEGEGAQKRKGRRRQEVTILLSVVAPQRRQPPALPPFRAVPSAHAGLTSLFGMGRGVTPPRRRRLCFRDPTQQGPRMPGERTSK